MVVGLVALIWIYVIKYIKQGCSLYIRSIVLDYALEIILLEEEYGQCSPCSQFIPRQYHRLVN